MLYAVGFGGYVAFSVYLPTYLKNAYGLTQSDASNKMAGFVLVAVVMRPVGGWLSDRLRPGPVLVAAFLVVAVAAFVQSATPDLFSTGTTAFLVLAAALGASSGAVFALVAQQAPANQVGAVTGLVGAAGGLGGFVPPLVMGSLYGHFANYSLGLIALGVVALLAIRASGGEYVSDQLRSGQLGFACEDPDAEENWPRVLTVWRSNLLGSSAKGDEYFLRHLIGSEDSLRATETPHDARRPMSDGDSPLLSASSTYC